MKWFFLFTLCSLLIGSSCRKHKVVDPVSQLPPETQTGANTFGCLVNGQVFKPGGAQLSGGSLQCNYQFVNGGYYFVLIGRYRNNSNGTTSSVGLYTDSLSLHEGDKLNLMIRIKGNPSGDYFKTLSGSQYEQYETNGSFYTGELWIKKYDSVNQIMSGTFSYDAVDPNGQKVEIREGRFDVRYTR